MCSLYIIKALPEVLCEKNTTEGSMLRDKYSTKLSSCLKEPPSAIQHKGKWCFNCYMVFVLRVILLSG